MESALILAIVVLGGMGSQLGVVLAALVMIGGFELFRELEQYRMLVFGVAHGADHDLAAARPDRPPRADRVPAAQPGDLGRPRQGGARMSGDAASSPSST